MTSRRGVTLIEFLVVIAILASLCGLLAPAILAVAANQGRSISDGERPDPPATIQMATVQHDGHWWILCRDHFSHHPDCPCGSRRAEHE